MNSEFKHIREDHNMNAALEAMLYNSNLDDEPYVGSFWYDPDKQELFGVSKQPLSSSNYYYSDQWNSYVRTGVKLHKDIWKREFHHGKDTRFKGDYTKKPRGRVFDFRKEGLVVYVGNWINDYPEAKYEIIYEFELPDNVKFKIDEYWDLGRGWIDEF